MRVLVMGAGAMGTVVGGFLAKAGHDVTLVGRAKHMDAIAQNGLRITGIWGEHHVATLHVCSEVAAVAASGFDLILICVKSYDTRPAVEAVLPLAGATTLVCAYQNGLGNAEIIAETVGWERTVGVSAIFGTRLNAPGCAEVTVIAHPTTLGVYHPAAPADRVREIAEAMDAAGLPTIHSDRMATVLWAKVAYNSALNPLSALLDMRYGALAETEHTRAIMAGIIQELYAVGCARGVTLAPESPEAYLELFYTKLVPPTAAHFASMHQDFAHRRRTEIDALNGAIARYGAELDIPCPVNTMLTRLVHAREYALGTPAAP